jgi:hypothetical protein
MLILFVLDYDSSAEIAYHLNGHEEQSSNTSLDFGVKKLLGMFANWDGIYFTGPFLCREILLFYNYKLKESRWMDTPSSSTTRSFRYSQR